jgi:hypothetical protein
MQRTFGRSINVIRLPKPGGVRRFYLLDRKRELTGATCMVLTFLPCRLLTETTRTDNERGTIRFRIMCTAKRSRSLMAVITAKAVISFSTSQRPICLWPHHLPSFRSTISRFIGLVEVRDNSVISLLACSKFGFFPRPTYSVVLDRGFASWQLPIPPPAIWFSRKTIVFGFPDRGHRSLPVLAFLFSRRVNTSC